MKKFYCNGKIVYLNNIHTELTAKAVLRGVGFCAPHERVCQALDKDQDLLSVAGPGVTEVFRASEDFEDPTNVESEDFLSDMLSDEDYDHYALPNGKSAPYGLTGSELAAMKPEDTVFVLSLSQVSGVAALAKSAFGSDNLLVAVDRDLIFATREKAVEAYNALFGDIYGEI